MPDADPPPPVAFRCRCGLVLGHVTGEYLTVYRVPVPNGQAGEPVVKLAARAAVLCTCQRERWYYPNGKPTEPAPAAIDPPAILGLYLP